jgi:hypothetical protein
MERVGPSLAAFLCSFSLQFFSAVFLCGFSLQFFSVAFLCGPQCASVVKGLRPTTENTEFHRGNAHGEGKNLLKPFTAEQILTVYRCKS